MNQPLLSIVTLALKEREELSRPLFQEIARQISGLPVEHVVFMDDGEVCYGRKMSRAQRVAGGEYVVAVDDDDWIEPDYVSSIIGAIESSHPDLVTIESVRDDTGEVWIYRHRKPDGVPVEPVERHTFCMMANHQCAWRRELAVRSPWPPLQYQADVVWYQLLNAATNGATEVHIDRVIYHYRFDPALTRCQRPEDCGPSMAALGRGLKGWIDDAGNLYAGFSRRHLWGAGEAIISDEPPGLRVLVDRLGNP